MEIDRGFTFCRTRCLLSATKWKFTKKNQREKKSLTAETRTTERMKENKNNNLQRVYAHSFHLDYCIIICSKMYFYCFTTSLHVSETILRFSPSRKGKARIVSMGFSLFVFVDFVQLSKKGIERWCPSVLHTVTCDESPHGTRPLFRRHFTNENSFVLSHFHSQNIATTTKFCRLFCSSSDISCRRHDRSIEFTRFHFDWLFRSWNSCHVNWDTDEPTSWGIILFCHIDWKQNRLE